MSCIRLPASTDDSILWGGTFTSSLFCVLCIFLLSHSLLCHLPLPVCSCVGLCCPLSLSVLCPLFTLFVLRLSPPLFFSLLCRASVALTQAKAGVIPWLLCSLCMRAQALLIKASLPESHWSKRCVSVPPGRAGQAGKGKQASPSTPAVLENSPQPIGRGAVWSSHK